jgi:outer membrane lipoprotein SlyB
VATRLLAGLIGLSVLTAGLLTTLSAQAAEPARTSQSAAKRGTVTDVQAVQVKGEGSGVGVVAGAVVGGLLGNQVGKGTGNALMTAGGAVAGGYAGNEVEKHVKKKTLYKTKVKLDNGNVQSFTVGQRYAIGARVQVSGQKLSPAP